MIILVIFFLKWFENVNIVCFRFMVSRDGLESSVGLVLSGWGLEEKEGVMMFL